MAEKDTAGVIKLRILSWGDYPRLPGWALKCNRIYPCKWGSEKMLTRPCNQGDRDWDDAATSQGMLAATRNQKKQGTDSL